MGTNTDLLNGFDFDRPYVNLETMPQPVINSPDLGVTRSFFEMNEVAPQDFFNTVMLASAHDMVSTPCNNIFDSLMSQPSANIPVAGEPAITPSSNSVDLTILDAKGSQDDTAMTFSASQVLHRKVLLVWFLMSLVFFYRFIYIFLISAGNCSRHGT
jgi:hypothetical protein